MSDPPSLPEDITHPFDQNLNESEAGNADNTAWLNTANFGLGDSSSNLFNFDGEWGQNHLNTGPLSQMAAPGLNHNSGEMPNDYMFQNDFFATQASIYSSSQIPPQPQATVPDPAAQVYVGGQEYLRERINPVQGHEESEQEGSTSNEQTPTRETEATFIQKPHTEKKNRNRVRDAWPMSDPHQIVPPDYNFDAEVKHIGRGTTAGRNWLAKWGPKDEPRLKYNVMIERKPGVKMDRDTSKKYPDPDKEYIPAKLTLTEICQKYPRHVWGNCLRIFGNEGWDGKQIWDDLPKGFRRESAMTRKWNYLQAALGREFDDCLKEEGRPRKIVKKGSKEGSPKRKTPGTDGDNDNDGDGDGDEELLSTPRPKKQRHLGPMPARPRPILAQEGPGMTMRAQQTFHGPSMMQAQQSFHAPEMTQAQRPVHCPAMTMQAQRPAQLHAMMPGTMPGAMPGMMPGTMPGMIPRMMPSMMSAIMPMEQRSQPPWQVLRGRCFLERASQVGLLRSIMRNATSEEIRAILLGRLWDFLGPLSDRYHAAPQTRGMGLDQGVRLLRDILNGRDGRADEGIAGAVVADPQDVDSRAWAWMLGEMRRWTGEWSSEMGSNVAGGNLGSM